MMTTNGNTPCISGGYANAMTEEDSDLIRRSDALECFHDWVDKYGDVHTPDEMPEYRAIEALPSVEPEIIRCKDCKWCRDADGLMCKNPASWVVATECDFGCVLAERRTDFYE